MEDEPLLSTVVAEQRRHFMRPVLASMAGVLLVASCSAPETSQSLPSFSTQPVPTRSSPSHEFHSTTPASEKACITPRIAVFPYQHFKPSNRDDLARQLQVLRKAHDRRAEVTVRDIVNAGAIVADGLSDPVYAQAFTYANTLGSRGVAASELLQKDFSKAATNCLEHGQLQQTDRLYNTLVDGLGPKVGHQLSTVGRVAYRELKSQYEDFKHKYHQELGY